MMPVFALHPRVLLIAIVVFVHAALLFQWSSTPVSHKTSHPMTVSLALLETAPAQAVATPVKTPSRPQTAQAKPQPATQAMPQPTPQPSPMVSSVAATLPVSVTASPPIATTTAASAVTTPVLPDREPDYQATYLNNPKPSYPSVANRMGWQGTVVVNVEVLATGLAGQLSVQRSSGHDVLDDAALQAIRHWRFVPARQNGQLVTQHFLVPIPFVLKESDE
ncbi:MAG: TonB family protein [Gallionella sp.]|nr:TonB family protein [Gallionella sp.]MDD4958202.1 TonB family protein [Gallionella sp.]